MRHVIYEKDYVKTKYDELIDENIDILDYILYLQEQLQNKVAEEKPGYQDLFGKHLGPNMTIFEMVKFFMWQNQSILDEHQEQLEALGGKDGNASWKYWKSKHDDLKDKRFSELSEEEQKEMKMEVIDELHFLINKFIALGMDNEEIVNLYYEKNKENINRQENGY